MKNILLIALSAFYLLGCSGNELRASEKNTESKVLNAIESEPINFGWMEGFPPTKDKVLSAQDGSFFRFPAIRYSVTRMREFMPTKSVKKGLNTVSDLQYDLDNNIDEINFKPLNSDKNMTWEESLYKNYTDGIIILHKGNIVYERYFSDFDDNSLHAVMSLTKSFTGTIASILLAEGIIDDSKLVKEYVPELSDSAFGDATVREVMDMTTGLQYSEDYSDPKAEVWTFSAAGNPFQNTKDYKGPVGYYEFLKTVKKSGNHGEIFGYKTVNSDVLGWVIAKASGKSVLEILQERIWKKMGMEQDAYFQIDSLGTPFAGGGFNAGLRDLARFGQLILNDGIWNGEQLIPKNAVLDIKKGGDKEAFKKSTYKNLPGWSYRDMWWITHNKHSAFMGRGVHGQAIYIDPTAEMVIVRLASHPVAGNSANDPFSLPAYEAIANYLLKK
jgi:hypothetical protein